MRTFDLTPLNRFSVGFDHLQNLLDNVNRLETQDVAYPPYNIEALDENEYRISMAVAGFSENDLEITHHEDQLIISGAIKKEEKEEDSTYLHRGIATRSFERRFNLADHITVVDAGLENGLLHIDLKREVPEEKQPKKIEIGGSKLKKLVSKAKH